MKLQAERDAKELTHEEIGRAMGLKLKQSSNNGTLWNKCDICVIIASILTGNIVHIPRLRSG